MRSERFAFVLLLLILLMPTGVAAWMYPLSFADAGDRLQAIGRLAGILGLTCLLVNTALSTRRPGFDLWFGGLTRLWRWHHYVGAASFVLLMLHPLLLAYGALAVSTSAAASLLLPSLAQVWIWMGWLGLLCMMVFLAPSFAFFGQTRYQRWKGMHLLSGVAVLLGLVHAVPLSRALASPWSGWIWGVLGTLAVAAFIYRALLSRLVARLPYRVAEVAPLAHDVVELTLVPAGARRLRYEAGQFVYFAHHDPGLGIGNGQQHPFTLTSAPQEAGLRLGIKDLGDLSGALQRIHPGAAVTVEGPYGAFFPAAADRLPQLWLAGGIGITPFVGRARALDRQGGRSAPILLVYCAENIDRSYYLQELSEIASRVPGFTVASHLFEREGALTASYLDRVCPDWRRREVFLCGPPRMLTHCGRLLREAGVRRFHTEAFDLL